MFLEQLSRSLAEKLQGEVLHQEPMKNHTTWKIGGPADILVIPNEIEEVIRVVTEANRHDIPITVIGNGSNILVKDGGIRGIVIKINNGLKRVKVNNNVIEAEAGVMLPKLARIAVEHSLTGLEFAAGIPATLGGAILMNAGALGGEIGRYIEKISWVDSRGNVRYTDNSELKFSYRQTILPEQALILVKAWLRMEAGESNNIHRKMTEYLTKRRMSQPINKPNSGSVFINPPGNFAGKIIEEAGLKGTKVGDAQISELHANFIINTGNATARDVLALIHLIEERVLTQSGIKLETEVRVLGENLTD
ncbi:MAG: UDP-N-acetylmuramate dehydrogenase [Clostridia bacterium]|nr:UDP-N-acetylmuramate dehydrogenase [Clostridia bacterium]